VGRHSTSADAVGPVAAAAGTNRRRGDRDGRARLSPRGKRTRAALVKAAREVFERDGFLDARITDITSEAGVATGTFYTYFAGKEEAFAAVLEDLEEEMLHPRLAAPAADREDPVAVIEAANRAYLESYRRNAKLMGLMEQVTQVDPEFMELRMQRTRAFTQRNTRALRRLQERGLARPDLDPALAALALSTMVSRTAYARYVLGLGNASTDALTETLTRLWVGALGIDSRTKPAKETN
jgi:AcrR family transcriptional regulator